MNTKEKLMQLLELCIEKGLTYNYSAHVNSVTVFKPEDMDSFRYYTYVDYMPSIMTDELVSIDDLITKVKNYQP